MGKSGQIAEDFPALQCCFCKGRDHQQSCFRHKRCGCLKISSLLTIISFPINCWIPHVGKRKNWEGMPQITLCGRKSYCHEIQWLLMKVLTPIQNPKRQHRKQNETSFLIVFPPLILHTVILCKCNSNEFRKSAQVYIKMKLRCFSKALFGFFSCKFRTSSEIARMELINALWTENPTAFLLSIKYSIGASNVAGVTFSQQAVSWFLDLSYSVASKWSIIAVKWKSLYFLELLQISMFALCLK